jgi:hypothetical protein
MPVDLTWEARGVVRQLTGFVTAEEFVASAHQIESHPDFDRFVYLIDDFTGSTGNGIDGPALEEVAAICFGVRTSRKSLRVFIVTPHDGVRASALSAQAGPTGGAFETMIVPTRAVARAILGLEPG